MEILLISGMSGAGKSRVAAALEDMDFYCVDNMPAKLMPRFAEFCMATRGRYEHVALVTDVRGQESFDDLFQALDELREMGCGCRILYVCASVDTIVSRYKESRRPHPLDVNGLSLEDAVRQEIELLKPVRARADYEIDTTALTLGQLRRQLRTIFSPDSAEKNLSVTLMSFGFKYGIPIEADTVFDVRFMRNPYYVAELRDKTGLSPDVASYALSGEAASEYMELLKKLIAFMLPKCMDEGKSTFTVCVGCTGGRHRSVAVAEELARYVFGLGYPTETLHRDMARGS
ncbi:MAG: RNase adapter RapZ [Oscillospiraceae bacterium]|nr:RNase adapter RapZ [Oscillospiraceae bacterium]